jgi:hypothetical protein
MGQQCDHCLTVYPIDAERCPGCGPRNSIDHAVAKLAANQDTCPHEQITPTQVGGYTCNRCGLYLFRKPGESYKPYPATQ